MDLSEWDFDAVATENERALKNAGDGESLPFWSAGKHVLIGPGHPAEYYDLFTAEGATFYNGTVTVTKGGLMSGPGTLTFSGVGGGRGELEAHIEGFSKKKVEYS